MIEEIQLSPIVIGAMRLGKWGANFDEKQLTKFVNECIELGMTTFDHADIYGDYTTEAEFGGMLKNNPELREEIQIITKCGINRVCDNRPQYLIKSYDSSSEHIIQSVDNSLKNFNTDYLDILLLHRPDFLMNPHEIAETIADLQESGKVKAFGVSNFSASQFNMLNEFVPLCTNQIEVSITELSAFSDGRLDQCINEGIYPMAWSPLGGGRLFSDKETPQSIRIKEVAKSLCEKYNATLDQILLAFLVKHPVEIVPVIGTSKIERVEAAVDALEIILTNEEWYDLYQASTGETIA